MVTIVLVGGPYNGAEFEVPDDTRSVRVPEATPEGDDRSKTQPMAHFYTTHGGTAVDGLNFTYQGCARNVTGGSGYETVTLP